MPLSSGLSIHDDTKHKGSAKRDAVSGVAGIDSRGFLIAPADAFLLKRDATDNVGFRDRDTDEVINYWHRVAVDDWQMFVRSGAAFEEVQLDNMKDAANGIAGLDGSVEIPVALLKTNVANGVAGLDADQKIGGSAVPGLFSKYVIGDADLHTHNTEEGTGNTAYTMLKQMLLSTLYPTPSTIRVRFQLRTLAGDEIVYGRIYKGVTPVGTERSTNSDTPITFDEDISFAQGDALRIYAKTAAGIDIAVINDFVIRGSEHQLTFQEALDDSHAGLLNPVVAVNS